MTPIVIYKSGDCYYTANGGSRLKVARDVGKVFILAVVWEMP